MSHCCINTRHKQLRGIEFTLAYSHPDGKAWWQKREVPGCTANPSQEAGERKDVPCGMERRGFKVADQASKDNVLAWPD